MAATQSQTETATEPLFDDDFMATLAYLNIIARKILSGQMKAERRSRQKGVSVEFADHRPYTPGDDFRFIDWSVYFRTDHLFLKLFEEEEDLQVYLLLDCSASMGFGNPDKFIYARRLAAAIGYLGLASMDRVHIIPIVDSVPMVAADLMRARGKGKIFQLLSFLEQRESGGVTDLQTALQRFSIGKHKRGMAIVISDLYDNDGVEPGLNALRFQKYDPYVIHLVSPQEMAPELLGDLRLIDGETGRTRDVTLTEGLLKKYRETFEAHGARMEAFCRSRAIGYARCVTSTPFQDTVVHMLRRGKLLQ
tara:strand:- start:847 stop:1767 length:921 start_codon:yes stop_codon:yes gene_type:complete